MIATTVILQRVVGCSILCALSLALFMTFPSHASAALMAPGASVAASGEPDPTGGVPVTSTGPLPFATANYSGTLESSVIKNDPSNPFGLNLGLLTFTYRLTNNAGSFGEIDRLTINGFPGFQVDASYQTPAAGLAPALMNRSTLGDVVGFGFIGTPFGSGVLNPNTSSALLVVQTDATTFAPTLASVIDGLVTTVGSFAPGGPGGGLPEPCSLVLAGIGLIGLAPLGRRIR